MNSKRTNGFLLLNRDVFNGPAFNHKNPLIFKMYMYCLSMANYADSKEYVNGKEITVKRGQFLTTNFKLMQDLGATRQSVRTSLKFLELTTKLTTSLTTRFRLVTVCNYDKITSKKVSKKSDVTTSLTTSLTTSPSDLYYKTSIKQNKKKDYDKKSAREIVTGRRRPFGDLDFKTLWRYSKAQGVGLGKRHSYIARVLQDLNMDSVSETVNFYRETVLQRWDQRKRMQLKAVMSDYDRAERATKEQAAEHLIAIKRLLGG